MLRLELCVVLVALCGAGGFAVAVFATHQLLPTCFHILGHSLTFFPLRLFFSVGSFIRNEGAQYGQMMVGIVGNFRTVFVRLQFKEEM